MSLGELLEVLVRSQLGYGARRFNEQMKRRALQIAVGGGDVVREGGRKRTTQRVASPHHQVPYSGRIGPLPVDTLDRGRTVVAGVETFAKLFIDGVKPGQGGWELTDTQGTRHYPTATRSSSNSGAWPGGHNPPSDGYEPPTDPSRFPHISEPEIASSRKSYPTTEGITSTEMAFLVAQAKAMGVQFPKKEDAAPPSENFGTRLSHSSGQQQQQHQTVYKPQLPEEIKALGEVKAATTGLEHFAGTTALDERSKESRVPNTRLGRLANFGMLALGLSTGAAAEVTRRTLGYGTAGNRLQSNNPFLTPANAERIVETLCRVRGAALKLGQMLSIQDEGTVPSYLLEIFERVRHGADFMPTAQVHRQLRRELGDDWAKRFAHFDEKPFAAASIGQVHKALLLDGGGEVAVKIQYPGVADGIDSDLDNLVSVLNIGGIFPRGLFLDNFVSVARRELKLECDYEREVRAMEAYRQLINSSQLSNDYYVPRVYKELSTKRVLTAEFIHGTPVDRCVQEPQSVRDYIAAKFFELCLNEIFVWRFMQIKLMGQVASVKLNQENTDIYELVDIQDAGDPKRARKFTCLRVSNESTPNSKKPNPAVGSLVTVVGKLRLFNNRLTCNLLGIIAVEKEEEVKLHMAERKIARIYYRKTDPNWSNFLLGRHPTTGRPALMLLDFGAARGYPKRFIDQYMRIIKAAYDKDEEAMLRHSRAIGFLTGYESKVMEQAHCESISIIGETLTSMEPYDFSRQSVTRRIHNLLPVMIEHRLKSPPDEIYSMHRKLAGCFLIAAKLKAVVSCGPLFLDVYKNYRFEDAEGEVPSGDKYDAIAAAVEGKEQAVGSTVEGEKLSRNATLVADIPTIETKH